MSVGDIMNTGRSGMMATKAAIATAGHNISNANTEGFSRQRVEQVSAPNYQRAGEKAVPGRGVGSVTVNRTNDEYIERQIRSGARDLAYSEEKDLFLRQTEDIFNEMGGEGLNRLMTRFFNGFRQLANEPDSEAVRQSVRENAQALVGDIRKLRASIDDVRKHIDSRIEGYVREMNAAGQELAELNQRIRGSEIGSGSPPPDLLDKRDNALKRLGSFVDVSMKKDENGQYDVTVKGIGPMITGGVSTRFDVERSAADDQGKGENWLDIKTDASASGAVTHRITGGKLGALLETRQQTVGTILDRLDQLAYGVASSVNQIHEQGFNRYGQQGIPFFKLPSGVERAAEFIDLSDGVKSNVNFIATAAQPDSPGDNRVAIALAGLQSIKMMNDGKTTVDDFYNGIVTDIGVITARNRNDLNQHRDVMNQLSKIREQISGVSIDEETANLLQFQHQFGASAKVIQVADEMMKTILQLGR